MSLVKKAIAGTSWTATSMIVQVVVQLLRLSVLARFLTKADFGLVAIVTLILGFTHIFADLGVSTALFYKQNITKKEYSSLYWVNILLSLALYIILVVISPIIAGFYKQHDLLLLIPIVGLDLILATAGRQFKIFQQKSLQFRKIAIIEITGAVSSMLIAVVMALKGWGIYSLIYSTLFNSFVTALLFIITGLRKYPLLFYINISENKEFYKIGLYQTGSQILDYFSSQIDIILVSILMSPSNLGVYNLVKQLVLRPYNVINPVITNVVVPLLAKVNDKSSELRLQYSRMLEVVGFLNFPVYALIAILAKEVLFILYGPSYIGAAIYLQGLCVWGAISSLNAAASTLVVILGRTDIGFRWTFIRLLTNPVFILVGAIWGILGIVIGQAICSLIYLFLYWRIFIMVVLPEFSLMHYVKTYRQTFLSSLIAGTSVILLQSHYLENTNEVIRIGTPVVLFLLMFLAMNRKFIKQVFNLIYLRY